MERRLAAVLAADLVGYSRLMGADEQGTLRRLAALREELLEPLVAEHRGRIVKVMGDGFLVAFASVVDAVSCGLNWQDQVSAREAESDPAAPLQFRIGINLGDTIFEDGDIFGDGVNIAARLEALAPAGGLCLSALVRDGIKGKLDLDLRPLGQQSLKNIVEPVEAFVLESVRPPGDREAVVEQETRDRPRIAILPFENLSGDPEQDYFADGITEDILTCLSRIPELTVIDRHSSFTYKGKSVSAKQIGQELDAAYILEGSVRRGGSRLRITTQLIDCASGGHLWAERYDRSQEDIFEIQDEITRRITTALSVELVYGGYFGNYMRGTENFEAWDALTKGSCEFLKFSKEGMEAAEAEADRALALDPDYSVVFALKGWCKVIQARYFSSEPERLWAEARAWGEKALAHSASRAQGLGVVSFCQLGAGQLEEAVRSFKEAIALAPTAENHFFLGQAYLYLGDPEASIAQTEQAMRVSPLYPGFFLTNLIEANRILGRLEDALSWTDDQAARMPESPLPLLRKAGLLALAGRRGEAERLAKQFLAHDPSFTLTAWLKGQPYRDPTHIAPLTEALRDLGLPD